MDLDHIIHQAEVMVGLAPPGDPAVIRGCAAQYQADAVEVNAQRSVLLRQLGTLEFVGPAGERFRQRMQQAADELDQCARAIEQLAELLGGVAARLDADQREHHNLFLRIKAKLFDDARHSGGGGGGGGW